MLRRRSHGIHVPVQSQPRLPGQFRPSPLLPTIAIFTPKKVIHGIG
jgi:hypothetical protein